MLKIATHDSATGEKGKGLLSFLLTPFAKTQSKTIKEQYEAGCRSFDIRVILTDDGWYCAHGLWITKRTADSIIKEINSFKEKCQVCVVYEGQLNSTTRVEFLTFFITCRTKYTNIIWGYCAGKYSPDSKGIEVKYEVILYEQPGYEGGKQGFLPLDGRSWHTYIPIPWLWNKLYTTPHKFNETEFTYVDFF